MVTEWMMSACLYAAACAMGWLAAGISGRLDGRARSAHTTEAPSMACWADAVGLRLTTNAFPSRGGQQHTGITRDICPRCQSPKCKQNGREPDTWKTHGMGTQHRNPRGNLLGEARRNA